MTNKFLLGFGDQRKKICWFASKIKALPQRKIIFPPHILSYLYSWFNLMRVTRPRSLNMEDEKYQSFIQPGNASSDRTNFPCEHVGAFIHSVLSFLDYCIKLASNYMETLYLNSREHNSSHRAEQSSPFSTKKTWTGDLRRHHVYILLVQGTIFQTWLSSSPPILIASDSCWDWLQNDENSKTRHFMFYFWSVKKSKEWEMSGVKPALGDNLSPDKRDLKAQPSLF